MKTLFAVVCIAASVGINVAGQSKPAHKADDLVGTWELVSVKNITTGAVTPYASTQWMLFTKYHWMLLAMDGGRKVVPNEEFSKLAPESQLKARYGLVWNEKGDHVSAARGGTYRLEGDDLHQLSHMALVASNVGVDRVLKITHRDNTTLVAQTEYPDQPNNHSELTFRRLD